MSHCCTLFQWKIFHQNVITLSLSVEVTSVLVCNGHFHTFLKRKWVANTHLCWLLLVNGYLMASVCTCPSGPQDHGVSCLSFSVSEGCSWAHCDFSMHTLLFGSPVQAFMVLTLYWFWHVFANIIYRERDFAHFWGLCHARKLMKLTHQTCEKFESYVVLGLGCGQ